MAAPYARSVFGAQTGLGAMDPVELQVDMGAYANRRTDPHAFGAGHQFGPMPGVRGLGQQVVVQRTRLGDAGVSALADSSRYSFWGAFAGTAAMGAILMVKYPKLPRGVGFAGVLPLLGVLAGQMLATRKV